MGAVRFAPRSVWLQNPYPISLSWLVPKPKDKKKLFAVSLQLLEASCTV